MHHTGQVAFGKDLTAIFQQEYHDYFFSILDKLRCPHCQNPSGLRTHGRYARHLYLNNEQHIKILVSRMICTCGKTFVVLPPSIIPFKRYVLEHVLDAIRLARTKSRYHLEQRLGISSRLIHYWQGQYQAWHQALDKILALLDLSSGQAAQAYNQARPKRRFMQIISDWTQPFHALI